ncbi:hypothetical protein SAMN05877753_110157 [Bacillus oleivorans]|uniref:Uncharacterized protein n=1 Tax=Bacillus oleivorans TaxID=1448271 RepID=A0A285D6F5_9BACI|nr:hypothetical protein [Bacillus oleivorans]SNX74916.1 hypothetical protein SAMN05877753_110157 [Bacillus oleivorans]
MAEITTGPFRAPANILGAPGVAPNFLIIVLKNPTNETQEVRVEVHECPGPNAPVIPPGARCATSAETVETLICNEIVLINSDRCRDVFVTVTAGNIYRVTISGDIDLKAEKVEVSVVGTDAQFRFHDPSMFFRHEDFIKVDDDDDDDDD